MSASFIFWVPALLTSAALLSPGTDECAALAEAHAALLAGRFSVERSFTLTVSGELKARELSRLHYSAGELRQETLEKERLDKRFVLEAGDKDSGLSVPFACERIEQMGDGRYRLTSPNGKEKVVFVESEGPQTAWVPVSWREDDTARFFWKKLVFEAVAEYRDFVWR